MGNILHWYMLIKGERLPSLHQRWGLNIYFLHAIHQVWHLHCVFQSYVSSIPVSSKLLLTITHLTQKLKPLLGRDRRQRWRERNSLRKVAETDHFQIVWSFVFFSFHSGFLDTLRKLVEACSNIFWTSFSQLQVFHTRLLHKLQSWGNFYIIQLFSKSWCSQRHVILH